jgi:prophage tail gpP-like protein
MAGIRLVVNGVEYVDWTAADVSMRLDALSRTFGFEAVGVAAGRLPFEGGEPCEVWVDGEKVLTGSIELVNMTCDANEHRIDVQGRDLTGDFIDSDVSVIDELNTDGLTLKRIIEIVLAHIGSTLSVVDNAAPKAFNIAEDGISPEPGDNAFDYCETLARKRQVLLTGNAHGNVVIDNNVGLMVDGVLQHRAGDPTNNVTRCELSKDSTGRFNLYYLTSQLNPLAIQHAGDIPNAAIVEQTGATTDDRIRLGRQMVLVSESMYSAAEAEARVWWEYLARWARSFLYVATVVGFRHQGGELWEPNTIISVDDEYANIDARLLVAAVRFAENSTDGAVTELTCLRGNAFAAAPAEPGPGA